MKKSVTIINKARLNYVSMDANKNISLVMTVTREEPGTQETIIKECPYLTGLDN